MNCRQVHLDRFGSTMSPISMEVDGITPTPIQKFYSGSNVFITGATGFLGKALVEKLTRSCPDIGTLFILVRPKKGKNVQQRLDDFLDDVVFERLNSECPKFKHKIVGIAGDCSLPGLGIDANDRQLLCSEVSVVFHVAATVRFDEKLKLAIEINVRGTTELLKMCAEMRQLKSLVHVSTAYSNCAQDVIEEIYYPVPIKGHQAILAAENFSDEILDFVTIKLLEGYPNTYALTKAVAEDVVKEAAGSLPIGIFRPSIVISSYKEPVAGWAENLYGPNGLAVGMVSGLIRTMHCNPEANANIIPVDMCVNGLIAIAWEVDQLYQESKRESIAYDGPIYHYESSIDRPITWGNLVKGAERGGQNFPTVNAIWYFTLTITRNRMTYLFLLLFLHYIPAMLMDGALFCIGKKPSLLKTYKIIHKFTDIVGYFGRRNFSFASTRMRRLITNMSPQDQVVFFCDLKRLDWEDYFKTYVKGIRVYLLKDPLRTLDVAQKNWKRLYWLHQVCKSMLSFLAFSVLWFVVVTFVL